MKYVIKRDGTKQAFNKNKIGNALYKCFSSIYTIATDMDLEKLINPILEDIKQILVEDDINHDSIYNVEDIQDSIEKSLMKNGYYDVAKKFIIYRSQHAELRFIKDRAKYIEEYSMDTDNAASNSEVDANANVQNKNVATLNSELYKKFNVNLSRYRISEKLKELYGKKAPDYIKDLESHIIYKHDEGSSAAIMPYCVAVTLYPFLLHGTSTLDGLKADPPKHLESFAGQFNNLAFLLSSQFAGAIAFGEFFNIFNFYCIKDFGEYYYMHDEDIISSIKNPKDATSYKNITIKDKIIQTFQNIVYTLNQPAGNRSYQSPFTNISYFDGNYWKALFQDFKYPDNTVPRWDAINYLQKLFIHWFNEERTKVLLTFPVETMALLSKDGEIIDKEYEDLTTEMYSKGHSFFTYISDNPNSLSSCCRLRNGIDDNEFSFTNGLTGVATGSKSVITINLSRFIQMKCHEDFDINNDIDKQELYNELIELLDRIYKYHTAYNELLWDLFNNKMLPVYSAGYISLNQQYLTIGINGLNEAAEFLGIECTDNPTYNLFCNTILKTINEQNKEHKTRKTKFNCEFVPAESLGIKNYDWDKRDGYWVPESRNCYNSYFYEPDNPDINVLDRFKLHGDTYTQFLDGGVGLHCNLQEHLSQEQYRKLLHYAIEVGCNYFTFNIPNSQCDDCGYIEKSPLEECPKCGSKNITQYTRIIGYLRPINKFSKGRRIEAERRVYKKEI